MPITAPYQAGPTGGGAMLTPWRAVRCRVVVMASDLSVVPYFVPLGGCHGDHGQ